MYGIVFKLTSLRVLYFVTVWQGLAMLGNVRPRGKICPSSIEPLVTQDDFDKNYRDNSLVKAL